MKKIALVQFEPIPGNPIKNALKVLSFSKRAAKNGADTVVFPEMTIPGYMVGDQWEDLAFLKDCEGALDFLKESSSNLDINIVIGTVTFNNKSNYEDGRPKKNNSVIVLHKGLAIAESCKQNLANYREFDDKRHFTSENPFRDIFKNLGEDLASWSICEDGWDKDYKEHPISYVATTLAQVGSSRKSVHFNLSCSPFTKGKNKARNRLFSEHAKLFDLLCYVNCVGIQNNGKNVFVLDGSTTIYNRKGDVLGTLKPFEECIGYVEEQDGYFVPTEGPWQSVGDPDLDEVLVYGTKKFLELFGIKKVVIGLSGGIDSALSAMIHAKAIGSENVICVNMPTKYNSDTTKDIAKEIAGNLGCPYMVVPIQDLVQTTESLIEHSIYQAGYTKDTFRMDSENIQARHRGATVLGAIAAGVRGVFPSNGNKAEATVGYATLGGDLEGYLAPIVDLWKEEVYEVSRILSKKMGDVLPKKVFEIAPSAELSEEQDLEDGDPIKYWYHDKLFASWMEPWNRMNVEDSLRLYREGALLSTLGISDKEELFKYLFPTEKEFIEDLEKWWGLFKGLAAVKRVQTVPGLVLSRRAYGFDFREHLGPAVFTEEYKRLKGGCYA